MANLVYWPFRWADICLLRETQSNNTRRLISSMFPAEFNIPQSPKSPSYSVLSAVYFAGLFNYSIEEYFELGLINGQLRVNWWIAVKKRRNEAADPFTSREFYLIMKQDFVERSFVRKYFDVKPIIVDWLNKRFDAYFGYATCWFSTYPPTGNETQLQVVTTMGTGIRIHGF